MATNMRTSWYGFLTRSKKYTTKKSAQRYKKKSILTNEKGKKVNFVERGLVNKELNVSEKWGAVQLFFRCGSLNN